jgi:hypothetical protein
MIDLDVPAPNTDYYVPSSDRSAAVADPVTEGVADTNSVLELPQVVDPADYASPINQLWSRPDRF